MKLLIAGAGGHGAVVGDAAEQSGRWDDIAFIDDSCSTVRELGHWDVLGPLAALDSLHSSFDAFCVAIGDSRIRLETLEAARRKGWQLANVVHPFAAVSPLASLGEGTVVLGSAVVNPFASTGVGCIVNTGSSVDHHCELADGVHIAPGATLAATVTVGRCSWVGAGATVIEEVSIGESVVIGAGGVVIKDIADGTVVGGVPARELRAGKRLVKYQSCRERNAK